MKSPEVRLIAPLELIISSSQAILFAFTLITLFNPSFVTSKRIIRQLIPVFIFTFMWSIFAVIWGDPTLKTLTELRQYATHPTVTLRIIYTLFYIIQLFYLSRMFFTEEKRYEQELNNYFANNYKLRLSWVRLCFYSALIVGIIALSSFFFYSPTWVIITAGIYAVFYGGFALFYIQYPKTYKNIERVIEEKELVIYEKSEKADRQLTWDKLKEKFLIEKNYLNSGINIEGVAQQLKISRTTLSGYINKEEGVNFNVWINTYRIEEAKRLFTTHPDLSISEVSEKVGFSEQSNFSRQFKLITQQSPSQWRQQNKATNP